MNFLKALPMTESHGKPSDTLEIRAVTSAEDVERFNSLCQEQHCLGAAHVVGDFLRQVAILDGQWAQLPAWGLAACEGASLPVTPRSPGGLCSESFHGFASHQSQLMNREQKTVGLRPSSKASMSSHPAARS